MYINKQFAVCNTQFDKNPAIAGMDRPFRDIEITPKGHSRFSNTSFHFYDLDITHKGQSRSKMDAR